MTPLNTLQDLIRAGTLQFFHDYRRGDMLDLSGQGNHGTLNGDGYLLPGHGFNPNTSGFVQIADVAGLQGTTYSLVVVSQLNYIYSDDRIIAKEDAGGVQYRFIYSTGTYRIRSTSSAGTTAIVDDSLILGAPRTLGLTCTPTDVTLYIDGSFVSTTAQVRTADDAAITIGNSYLGTSPMRGIVQAALQDSSALSAAQHRDLYLELIR